MSERVAVLGAGALGAVLAHEGRSRGGVPW
jgi:hypothetical protein